MEPATAERVEDRKPDGTAPMACFGKYTKPRIMDRREVKVEDNPLKAV